MIILYAIISCDQPLFTLYFSVWEILRGFYSPFHSLSLSIPFTPLSLSLSLSLISPSLSISLLLHFFLSLFSLSFSLAYLMDVFVLVKHINLIMRILTLMSLKLLYGGYSIIVLTSYIKKDCFYITFGSSNIKG